MAGYYVNGGPLSWQQAPSAQGSSLTHATYTRANYPTRPIYNQYVMPPQAPSPPPPVFDHIQLADCLQRMTGEQQDKFRRLRPEKQRVVLQMMIQQSQDSASSEYDSDSPVLTPASGQGYSSHPDSVYQKLKHFCHYERCGQGFERRGDLTRHFHAKHDSNRPRFDCPMLACDRIGNNGLPRQDKVYDHLREKHKIPLPKRTRGQQKDPMYQSLLETQHLSNAMRPVFGCAGGYGPR